LVAAGSHRKVFTVTLRSRRGSSSWQNRREFIDADAALMAKSLLRSGSKGDTPPPWGAA
jgi:hypothetical protein